MGVKLCSSYEAIIIGAGVGGLTCGNYLAKAGVKTLILERHVIPGGYASSFKKNGFYFDAAAHYLSSCRERGQLGRLIYDHGLDRYMSLERCDPSDTIIMPEHVVELPVDFNRLVGTFQEAFPGDTAAIERFFCHLANTDATTLYIQLKEKTFTELMQEYFHDQKLMATLEVLLANIGAPASRASALSAAFLFREYIFDGGYYPKGGMQAFCDALARRFTDYGGTIAFGTPAKAIKLQGMEVVGVEIKGGEVISTKCVISNCSPFLTMLMLANGSSGLGMVLAEYQARLKGGVPSISAFMTHLGTKEPLRDRIPYHGCLWYCPTYDVGSCFAKWMDGVVDDSEDGFVFVSSPSLHDRTLAPPEKDSLQLIVGAPYRDRNFWEENRERFSNILIQRAANVIRGLPDIVEFQASAIPQTLEKYTLNHAGAMYGWAPVPSQVGQGRLIEEVPVRNLYIVGHWSGPPAGTGGIPMAVYSGRKVAHAILRRGKARTKFGAPDLMAEQSEKKLIDVV